MDEHRVALFVEGVDITSAVGPCFTTLPEALERGTYYAVISEAPETSGRAKVFESETDRLIALIPEDDLIATDEMAAFYGNNGQTRRLMSISYEAPGGAIRFRAAFEALAPGVTYTRTDPNAARQPL